MSFIKRIGMNEVMTAIDEYVSELENEVKELKICIKELEDKKVIRNMKDVDNAFIEIFSSEKFHSYFETENFKESLRKELGYVEIRLDKLGMSLFLDNKKIYTIVKVKKLNGVDVCMYVPVEVDLEYFGYIMSVEFFYN